MKKIVVIGGAIFLIVSGVKLSFGKKDTIMFDNTNNGNQYIEQEIPKYEENKDTNEEFDEINNEDDSNNDNIIEEEISEQYQMTVEFKGFADSHSVEIYTNGEYQVMQINDNVSSRLKNTEVGEKITIIYSTNKFGSNTIIDLK